MPNAAPLVWRFRGADLTTGLPGGLPLLMGILNVTPDSFSDGGKYTTIETAVAQAESLVAQGAGIIDVGGESTRPGAPPVSVEEESQRVAPVIAALRSRGCKALISVDTSKSAVARAALDAGAEIVNDVTGLTADPALTEVCAETGCGVVIMHMQGTPQTMQLNPTYADAPAEVQAYLASRLRALQAAGIAWEALAVDPGIGFGKTDLHNLQLLGSVRQLRELGRPVLIGHSRKSFLKRLLNRPLDERLFGTVGVSVALAEQGADILRLHDIAPNRDALLAWSAVRTAIQTNQANSIEQTAGP